MIDDPGKRRDSRRGRKERSTKGRHLMCSWESCRQCEYGTFAAFFRSRTANECRRRFLLRLLRMSRMASDPSPHVPGSGVNTDGYPATPPPRKAERLSVHSPDSTCP